MGDFVWLYFLNVNRFDNSVLTFDKFNHVGIQLLHVKVIQTYYENSHYLKIAFRRAQQVNISGRSLRRILHDDLGLRAYKVQLTQELLPNDHANCRDWMLEQHSVIGRHLVSTRRRESPHSGGNYRLGQSQIP